MPHLSTFLEFRQVDRLMSIHRDGSVDDEITLWHRRNSTKHAILSLPRRDLLDCSEGRVSSVYHRYECSRITAVLYANTVSWPVPLASPGIQDSVRILREELECCDLEDWTEETPAFLLWLLLVGGIAAYRTVHWSYFVPRLRAWMQQSRAPSFQAVQSMVQNFIWSEAACGEGARVLWEAATTT
jgi:hypothetical protein